MRGWEKKEQRDMVSNSDVIGWAEARAVSSVAARRRDSWRPVHVMRKNRLCSMDMQ